MRDTWRRQPRSFGIQFLRGAVGMLALLIVAQPTGADASHRKGTFPDQGLLWMSGWEGYSGNIWVSSNSCNQGELDAFAAAKSSTTGTSEMSRWRNGMNMTQHRCDGVFDYASDIQIVYKDQSYFRQSDGSYIGGRNVDLAKDPNVCSYWGKPYPCGQRPQVQINQQKYYGASATYRKREILHETGHSHGLSHHCSGNSIMNDGSSSCNSGKFTSLSPMVYYATDRTGISSTYP